VVMPRMSGARLIEELHVELPGLVVLLLSGYPAESIPGPLLPDGDYAFLQKPFDEDSLLQKVAILLES
jgi:FixJ family two-component response regulator